MPEQIGLLTNLEALHIAYNKLTVLPESLGKLDSLRLMRVTGNPLPMGEIIKIKKLLPKCRVDYEKSQYEKLLEEIINA